MKQVQIAVRGTDIVYATVFYCKGGLAVEKSPYGGWGVVLLSNGNCIGTCQNSTRKAAQEYQERLLALPIKWDELNLENFSSLDTDLKEKIQALYKTIGTR